MRTVTRALQSMALIAGLGLSHASARADEPAAPAGHVVSLPDVNVELLQPDGCEWRPVDRPVPAGLHVYACVDARNLPALVLMAEDHDYRDDDGASYFEPARRGFEQAAQKLDGTVASVRHERADFGSRAYRIQAHLRLPRGDLFTYSYVTFHDRAYILQVGTPTQSEPPVVLEVAQSLRLLRAAAPPPASSIGRWVDTAEGLLVAGALLYIWYRRSQKHLALGLEQTPEPPDPGEHPGVHL